MPTMPDNHLFDAERVLRVAGAVELCRAGTDLYLTPRFRDTWRKRINTARAHDLGEGHLTDALDLPSGNGQLTVDQQVDAFVAYTDDAIIGQWSSQAAAVADVAAADAVV